MMSSITPMDADFWTAVDATVPTEMNSVGA